MKFTTRGDLVAIGLAVLGMGAAIWLGGIFSRPAGLEGIDARQNPFPPTPESLAQGERVYQAHCAVCHGADGRGHGPAAAGLYPPPVDFWVHFGSGHTHSDGRLYFWISDGMPGTGMLGFKDRLSDADRWHVVNFVKATFTPAER